MLSLGTQILDLQIGPEIGKGAFGEIYSCINKKSGIFWAMKTENLNSRRKTLQFEYEILMQIQSAPYFPRLGVCGQGSSFTFYTMELLGPAISQVLKILPNHKYTLSTSIRAVYHILKAIESFHNFGFIHRDIKPGNILTREGTECPICLIDFGLTHIYIDPKTKKLLPPREKIGFRGTKIYASLNAHKGKDLSRNDDVISWFYMSVEIITGFLPWRKKEDKQEIMKMKMEFDVEKIIGPEVPEMVTIWNMIKDLKFMETPPYQMIYDLLINVMERNNIKFDDPYDWNASIHGFRNMIAKSLDNQPTKQSIPSIVIESPDRQSTDMSTPLLPRITTDTPFTHTGDHICCSCC